jgi:hypothetical protein
MKAPGQLILLFALLSFSSIYAFGQTVPSTEAQEKSQTTSDSRINVDESFELNIVERQFTRENFEASTAVSTDGDAGLNLQIGVSLAAGRIEVLLRNVRGRVRFKGTLDRIMDIFSNRPISSPRVAP